MRALLELGYDGTALSGCPEVPGRRTVVGEVRAALARAGLPAAAATLSRTDAGVHAHGQVGVVELGRTADEGWLLRALDRHLPPDLRCTGAALVGDVPAVRAKTYRYTLDLSPFGDPFLVTRAWRVSVAPERLMPLAALLPGEHDFSAFRRRGETRHDLRRRVDTAHWEAHGDRMELVITGRGFPYRLVRSLVGAMVAVARGVSEDALRAALAGHPRDIARHQAPARGLCLESIRLEPAPAWVREARPSDG